MNARGRYDVALDTEFPLLIKLFHFTSHHHTRGERMSGYAFRFHGLLRVPSTGLYLLHMQGADGYRIALDGGDVLTWDGPHGPAEKTAVQNLAAGDHAIVVDYFVDKAYIPFFKLEWEGPGVARQEIPRTALQRHVYCHEGFITPRHHTELLLGTTYEPEDLPAANAREHRDRIALADLQRIIAANKVILPQIESLEVARVWRNWRPTPSDDNPIVGAVADEPRLLIANGFIGLGLTLSPAVGDGISRYFARIDASPFPNSFSPNRTLP